MRKIFLAAVVFFLTCSMSLKAYEDLGVYGEMYEIKEKDFRQLLQEKWDKVDKNEVTKALKSSVRNSFVISSSIKECSKTLQKEYEPIIELKEDLVLPYTNEVINPKGTYNILEKFNILLPYNILFINADDELQVELAEFYKSQLGHKIKIMVVKGDYLKFTQNRLFKDAQIVREELEIKAFNLQCIPSVYTQANNKFIIQEYNPKELLKDEKKAK
jgi:hypothetical protein